MVEITGWQHIFTSVERERSPRRQRGYQTLFNSEGLSSDDLRILEGKAQYYSTPGEPVKRQFFWLPGDRWVVSQAVALAELDEFGRKGRYLVHSLVLPLEAWQRVGAAPFGVWTAGPFVKTLDEAFEQGDMANGHIPPRSIRIAADWQERALAFARKWSPDALLEMLRVIEAAGTQVSPVQTMEIVGNQAQIGEVLLVSFLLASPEKRRQLTFDTHASGCNWGVRDRFWALGLPTISEAKSPWRVGAESRLPRMEGLPVAPPSPYGHWLQQTIRRGTLEDLAARQDWALALDGLLQGRRVDQRLLAGMEPRFFDQFATLNSSHIRSYLVGLLPAGLPPPLVERVLRQLGRTPSEQLKEIGMGLSHADMNDVLYETLMSDAQPPSTDAQKALAQAAQQHAGLRRMLCLWSDNMPEWRKELDALSPMQYKALVEALLSKRAVPSWKLLSPQHVDTWFRIGPPHTRATAIVQVAQVLNECGGPAAVDRLAAWVPHVPPETLRQLQAWLSKALKSKPPLLWQALHDQIGGRPSVLDRIRDRLLGPD